MGIAMLFIIMFHIGMDHKYILWGLVKCGNVGVDIFLFLSGIGLWYSWTKKPNLKHFYWRRYLRIYPTWIIIAPLFYIPNYLYHAGYSRNVLDLIANITFNWSFWRIDDLTFWYVPAIMMMYMFAPAYMSLISKRPVYRWLPVVAIIFCFMQQYVAPISSLVGHVEIFWSRIPIFLLGINCGELVRQKRTIDKSSIWLLIILFMMSLLVCINFEMVWRGHYPQILERMNYIPLTVSLILLLVVVLDYAPKWLLKSFSFIGGISLEVYLLHAHFVIVKVNTLRLGFWLTFIITTLISALAGWLLSKVVTYITDKITALYHKYSVR
jgi:peptidoglycan/LPS O-acetylase OafA/YrhL